MTIQLSTSVRNAKLDAIESTIGTTAVLKIFDSGASPPANCAAADVGTALAILTLPSDWMAAAASGAKAKSGTWEDASADASGDADYFRIYESTATTCHLQGSAGDLGTEDLVLDNATINSGQQITITGFTLTEGNA